MRALALLALLVPTAAVAQPPPPPPGYAPAPGYGYAQTVEHRHGMTFEAQLGLGFIWVESEGDESDKEGALGGLNLGVGGWLNPRTAVTLRAAGVTYFDSEGGIDLRLTTAVLGPHVQYWMNDNFWIGGGGGLGIVALEVSADGQSESDSETGFGLDLRAGYTFSTTQESTWNVSFELTPSFITIDETDFTFYGAAFLFGYQHL